MKKVTTIILLLFYLLPTIGVGVSSHYCGGKLSSVSLLFLKNEKCKCGSKKMKKDCCKTNTFSIKIKDYQLQSPQTSVDLNKEVFNHPEIFYANNHSIFLAANKIFFHSYRPPSLQIRQPLYLLHGVFRI